MIKKFIFRPSIHEYLESALQHYYKQNCLDIYRPGETQRIRQAGPPTWSTGLYFLWVVSTMTGLHMDGRMY